MRTMRRIFVCCTSRVFRLSEANRRERANAIGWSGQELSPHPLRHLRVPCCICELCALVRIPRAAVLPRPPQHFQVAAMSGERTSPCVPWVFVLPKPLQHLPGARPERRVHNSLFPSPRCPAPTDNHAPAPTAIPPGARPTRPAHMSTHPKGSGAPEATSARPGARPAQRVHNSSR
jgi:hypothetical protein